MIDTDWRQHNKTFFDVLAVEANVMFVILTLIVLVAALNIVSGLIMLVQDKARAIAVLRTMGATRGAIHAHLPHHRRDDRRRRHVLRAAARPARRPQCRADPQGAVSWLLGVNLFPAEFYFLSQLPSRVETHDVIAVVADGAAAVARGDDLSVLARGAARSGRGAAL